MVEVKLPYGKEHQDIEVPDGNDSWGTCPPKDVPARTMRPGHRRSLDRPYRSGRGLSSSWKAGKDIVFIVNDGTRPTPTAKVLDALSSRFDLTKARTWWPPARTAPPPRRSYASSSEASGRSCRAEHPLPTIPGRTAACPWAFRRTAPRWRSTRWPSTPTDWSSSPASSPIISPATPAGGSPSCPEWRRIRPSSRTTELAMRPEAQVLALEGNPVHEDMMDALKAVKDKHVFSIQVVLDRHQRVYQRSFRGPLSGLRAGGGMGQRGVRGRARGEGGRGDHRGPLPDGRRPVPVAEGHRQRQVGGAGTAGSIILVSKCREGIGGETFYHQLSASRDPQAHHGEPGEGVQARLPQGGQAGRDHGPGGALRRSPVSSRRCWRGSTSPRSAASRRLWTHPWPQSRDAKVLVILDGSVTVPRVV